MTATGLLQIVKKRQRIPCSGLTASTSTVKWLTAVLPQLSLTETKIYANLLVLINVFIHQRLHLKKTYPDFQKLKSNFHILMYVFHFFDFQIFSTFFLTSLEKKKKETILLLRICEFENDAYYKTFSRNLQCFMLRLVWKPAEIWRPLSVVQSQEIQSTNFWNANLLL